MSTDHDQAVENIYLAQAWEGATGAMKAAMVLNGGAVVAILAFIGAMLQQSARQIDGAEIRAVMLTFCLGLAFSAGTHVIAYLTVYSYHQTMGSRRLGSARGGLVWAVVGTAFHLFGLLLLVGAFVTFFIGALQFADFAQVALRAPV